MEDSPVSAPLLFVMSLTILSWLVSTAPNIWQSLVLCCPEVYCTWFTLGDHFWRDSVFSAFGLTVDTCFCQSTEASLGVFVC